MMNNEGALLKNEKEGSNGSQSPILNFESGFTYPFIDLIIINAINSNIEHKIETMSVIHPEMCLKRRNIFIRD